MLPRINFENFNFFHRVACVGSVSNRVIARKLERSKKKNVKGGGGGEKRKRKLPSFPSPSYVIPFFFCSRPNFLHGVARKRLLRRIFRGSQWGGDFYGSAN